METTTLLYYCPPAMDNIWTLHPAFRQHSYHIDNYVSCTKKAHSKASVSDTCLVRSLRGLASFPHQDCFLFSNSKFLNMVLFLFLISWLKNKNPFNLGNMLSHMVFVLQQKNLYKFGKIYSQLISHMSFSLSLPPSPCSLIVCVGTVCVLRKPEATFSWGIALICNV